MAKFEEYAGGSESSEPRPSEAEIAKKVASFDRSGFDPKPYLERLDVPALWLFGGPARNVPPVQSVAELRSIRQERGKDWTIVIYPGAAHGLFDSPATDARAAPRAEVRVNVLDAHPNAKLRVLAIWLPMLAGDSRSQWPNDVFDDPRVVKL